MADQTERAFQKQKNVFMNSKATLIAGNKAKKVMHGGLKYVYLQK
jgi:hypothetical protein